MISRIRRSQHDIVQPVGTSSKKKHRLTFFSLPPEIRIAIYELVAEHSTLRILQPDRWKLYKSAPQPPPPLILVSKQCRAEYEPILLRKACLVAGIHPRFYDFSAVMRMSSNLYRLQLNSLRQNNQLIIEFQSPPKDVRDYALLRRWLARQVESLDRLSWEYRIAWPANKPISNESMRKAISSQLDGLASFGEKLDERMQWELDRIEDVYRREYARLTLPAYELL